MPTYDVNSVFLSHGLLWAKTKPLASCSRNIHDHVNIILQNLFSAYENHMSLWYIVQSIRNVSLFGFIATAVLQPEEDGEPLGLWYKMKALQAATTSCSDLLQYKLSNPRHCFLRLIMSFLLAERSLEILHQWTLMCPQHGSQKPQLITWCLSKSWTLFKSLLKGGIQ